MMPFAFIAPIAAAWQSEVRKDAPPISSAFRALPPRLGTLEERSQVARSLSLGHRRPLRVPAWKRRAQLYLPYDPFLCECGRCGVRVRACAVRVSRRAASGTLRPDSFCGATTVQRAPATRNASRQGRAQRAARSARCVSSALSPCARGAGILSVVWRTNLAPESRTRGFNMRNAYLSSHVETGAGWLVVQQVACMPRPRRRRGRHVRGREHDDEWRPVWR